MFTLTRVTKHNFNTRSNFISPSKRLFSSGNEEPPKYYAVLYKYKFKGKELLEKRAPHRAAHLDLAKNCPQLKMGGAWGDLTGALLLFHGTQKQAEDFVNKDPYVKNGIVEGFEVKEWTMVSTKYDIPTIKV